jgi:hypothetical protein
MRKLGSIFLCIGLALQGRSTASTLFIDEYGTLEVWELHRWTPRRK